MAVFDSMLHAPFAKNYFLHLTGNVLQINMYNAKMSEIFAFTFQRIYSNFFVPIPTLLIHQTKLFCFVFIRLELTFTKRRNNLHLLLCSSIYLFHFKRYFFRRFHLFHTNKILKPTFAYLALILEII